MAEHWATSRFMQIVKLDLEKRLAGLRAGRDGLLSDLHATDGAIQECEYWLNHLAADMSVAQLAKAFESGETIELKRDSESDSK